MKDHIINYAQAKYPFHMPGHKLGRIAPLRGTNLYEIDVTEVEGMDYLYQPTGIIKKAQDQASVFYGSMECFFLVNGSTGGILSAISACCQPDSKILMSRNSHKSVYNSVLINRLDPIYLYPEHIEEIGLLGGIDPNSVEKALISNPEIGCVVITSPSYEGFTSDIKRIANVVHQYNKLLIVDEAHGAHFILSNEFPTSAIECGADIVIHSLHKTLPAFTQSALLHVNNEAVDIEKLKDYLSIYQTSSPSYILMAGIDGCIKFLEHEGKVIADTYLNNLKAFRKKATNFTNMKLIGKEIEGYYSIKEVDLSKLVLIGNGTSLNGKVMEKELREKFNLQIELSMLESILAITTIADDVNAFDRFNVALVDLDKSKNCFISKSIVPIVIGSSNNKAYTPYEVSQKQQKRVNFKDAKNRISGQFITLYPPGIPILVPGEIITENTIYAINEYVKNGLKVLGIDHSLIKIIA
ncbi:MAG: ornithine decarboxylase [Firmicutes bacterium HGW-Firmicutes-7]|nr:MAG: ornithine decarboxylase [Firmicutes bacterium HGW-Firmicutes-7]